MNVEMFGNVACWPTIRTLLGANECFRVSSVIRLAVLVFPLIFLVLSGQSKAGPQLGESAEDTSAANAAKGDVDEKQVDAGSDLETEADAAESELTPRETYNAALRYLQSDPDRCERMLGEARQGAGVDGELRFRCLYNLGWVEVVRADQILEEEPEKALAYLEMAASRFRESIRIRKESSEARQNLEIVSRRILALRDSLAKKDPEGIAKRLDQIIESQRAHQQQLQSTTSVYAGQQFESEEARSIFRQLGVTQRQIISDLQKLSEDSSQEIAAASQTNPDQPPDQSQQVRAAQLSAMLRYVDSCQQRMGKARSFTRRQQAERAFVRWAAALTDAKRARDQLRDPIEILGVLIGDASELAQLTRLYSQPAKLIGVQDSTEDNAQQSSRPAWLSLEYLGESQGSMTQRTTELRMILEAGVKQNRENAAQGEAESSSQQDFLLESIENALPDIQDAQEQFEKAGESIESEDAMSAFQEQAQGITALMNAAEFFYDLRRMIEAIYADEQVLQQIAQQVSSSSEFLEQAVSMGSELQNRNLGRAERLKLLLDQERQKVADSAQQSVPQGVAAAQGEEGQVDEQLQQQMQRFDIADEILKLATEEMHGIDELLAEINRELESQVESGTTVEDGSAATAADEHVAAADTTVERPPSPSRRSDQKEKEAHTSSNEVDFSTLASKYPQERIEKAVEHIEDLRRLFFSAIEHLRETARRQSDLNDEVAEEAGLNAEIAPNKAGPFGSRQQSLEQIAQQLADVFREQAEQTQAAANPDPSGQAATAAPQQSSQVDPEQVAAQAEKLLEASKLIREGSESMVTAFESLNQLANKSANSTPQESTQRPEGQNPSGENLDSEASKSTATDSESTSAAEPSAEAVADDESKIGLDKIRESQNTALQKLAEALALLDQQQQNDDQQENDQQQNQDQNQQQQQNQQNEQQQQNMSANQMLQAIRDREAQRRKEKQQQVLGSGGVEKDW